MTTKDCSQKDGYSGESGDGDPKKICSHRTWWWVTSRGWKKRVQLWSPLKDKRARGLEVSNGAELARPLKHSG